MGFQRGHAKGIAAGVLRFAEDISVLLVLIGRAVGDQLKQDIQGVIKIAALALLLAGQRHQFQLAQVL